MDHKHREVEDILNNYTTLKSEIKNLNLEIEELQNDYEGCKAIDYGEKSSPTYKFNSNVENEVIAKDKKIKRLERLKRYREIHIEKIDNAMAILKEDEFNVITYRFFDDHKKSWTTVSRKMDRCEAWCKELKERAINKMIPLIFISEQAEDNKILAK